MTSENNQDIQNQNVLTGTTKKPSVIMSDVNNSSNSSNFSDPGENNITGEVKDEEKNEDDDSLITQLSRMDVFGLIFIGLFIGIVLGIFVGVEVVRTERQRHLASIPASIFPCFILQPTCNTNLALEPFFPANKTLGRFAELFQNQTLNASMFETEAGCFSWATVLHQACGNTASETTTALFLPTAKMTTTAAKYTAPSKDTKPIDIAIAIAIGLLALILILALVQ